MDDLHISELESGDLGWILMRHAELYAREAAFGSDFEAAVLARLNDLQQASRHSLARVWLARAGATRIGSLGLARSPDGDTARLHLFLVEPAFRGRAIGSRLLDTATAYARSVEAAQLFVSTYTIHEAACALYKRYGFTCVVRKPVHHYGVHLEQVDWALTLTGARTSSGQATAREQS